MTGIINGRNLSHSTPALQRIFQLATAFEQKVSE
jgi:hypothetical protein